MSIKSCISLVTYMIFIYIDARSHEHKKSIPRGWFSTVTTCTIQLRLVQLCLVMLLRRFVPRDYIGVEQDANMFTNPESARMLKLTSGKKLSRRQNSTQTTASRCGSSPTLRGLTPSPSSGCYWWLGLCVGELPHLDAAVCPRTLYCMFTLADYILRGVSGK